MRPKMYLADILSIFGLFGPLTLWLALATAAPLALGCNDVLGFVPGKPFPDAAATSDATSPDADASTDRSSPDGGGNVRDGAGEGGCGLSQCGAACTDTSIDAKNCGACNHDCTALMHIGTAEGITCVASRCVVPPASCAAGYAHCSANADDGCETDIRTATTAGVAKKSAPPTRPSARTPNASRRVPLRHRLCAEVPARTSTTTPHTAAIA